MRRIPHNPLYPDDPAYPRGAKRFWAIERYAEMYKLHGYEHPATRAALGRLWYHRGKVPQKGSTTPEAIGWERESGRVKGYMNRHARKHLAQPEQEHRDEQEAKDQGVQARRRQLSVADPVSCACGPAWATA